MGYFLSNFEYFCGPSGSLLPAVQSLDVPSDDLPEPETQLEWAVQEVGPSDPPSQDETPARRKNIDYETKNRMKRNVLLERLRYVLDARFGEKFGKKDQPQRRGELQALDLATCLIM